MARGSGTSMISLIVRANTQISLVTKMLTEEYGTASNIKSRVNRLSVLDAITSTKERLKKYTRCPPNGLVVYCGTILTDDGKEKRIVVDFEPFKPINTSLYLCDNKFHTDALDDLLRDDDQFGFIVVDGSGALYGTISGNTRSILYKFTVELPKKHRRGGQSSGRFARIRDEKRHNYVHKVAEFATKMFIKDNKPTVSNIVLAGLADFKNDLFASKLFDKRLKSIVSKVVDVSYGGENGFNQAIELAAESMANTKFIREKQIVQAFMNEIAQDSNKYCFGIADTMSALEMGAVDTLLVWDNLPHQRIGLHNNSTGADYVKIMSTSDEHDADNFVDNGITLKVTDRSPFVEWIAEHYQQFGTSLELISDSSTEGSQFVNGFGGVGATLRWRVDFGVDYEVDNDNNDDEEDYFM